MEKTKFNPTRLKEARIARGLTKKELADKTGISRQMISNYELGKTTPGATNLLAIIKELDFPKNFFSSNPENIYRGTTFFRSQAAATKRARDMQSIRLKFQKEIYNIFSLYVNFPEVNLPEPLLKNVEDITEEDIENMAICLRKCWKIDMQSPLHDLIGYAETNGVIVVESNMQHDKLDAVSEWIGDRPFIMLTDNQESAVRRRFNIAHELGHLLLHGDVESIHDYSSNELKIIEKQADYFASCLLLPEEAFIRSLLSINLEYYIELKKYWKVSMQAMIMRTFQIGLINEDQKLYLFKRIALNKWKSKEPLDNVIISEKPTLYHEVFQMIIENDLLTKNELINQLALPNDELEKSLNITIEKSYNSVTPFLRLV